MSECRCPEILREEAERVCTAYLRAKADPRLKAHVKQLQRRWVAYGWAAGVLERRQREGT